jgi:nitrate/nitrite transporter NarK
MMPRCPLLSSELTNGLYFQDNINWIKQTPRGLEPTILKTTLDQPARLPNTTSWINWGLGVVFLMSCVFSVVSFAIMAPNIAKETGVSSNSLSGVTSAFFFTYAFAQLAAGLLIDRIGARWLLGVTSLIASGGALLFLSSDDIIMMHVSRSIMAIGLSTSFVGGLYLASKWFPASRFGLMSGITNMAANFAGALGSWAIAGLSYQPIFLWWAVINAAIAVAILMLVRNRLPQTTNHPMEGPEHPRLLDAFGYILRSKQIWLASLFFTGTFGTFLSYANFWNIQIQENYGHTIRNAASLNTCLPIGLAIGSVAFGLFSDKIGKVSAPCRLSAVSSFVALGVLIYTPVLPVWAIASLLFLSGFCIGGSMLAFPAAIIKCAQKYQGAAIGLVTTCGYIGAGILNLIVPLITGKLSDPVIVSGDFTPTQLENIAVFKDGMIPLMISLLLAIFASILLRDSPEDKAD